MLIFELIPISRHKRKATSLGQKNNLLKTTGYKIKPREGGEGKTSEERPQMTFKTTLNSI